MTETLVWLGLSNLLLSAVAGLLAYAVHRRGRYPALAHLLWVLTLTVALTPPVLMLSMPLATEVVTTQTSAPGSPGSSVALATSAVARLAERLPVLLVAAWLAGSLVVFAASAQRIVRFGRLLRRSCRPAPLSVQQVARVGGLRARHAHGAIGASLGGTTGADDLVEWRPGARGPAGGAASPGR